VYILYFIRCHDYLLWMAVYIFWRPLIEYLTDDTTEVEKYIIYTNKRISKTK